MNFVVRDFQVDNLDDAAKLAEMFNDFDSAWPGGFARGDVQTAERVQERIAKSRSVAVLVAEDTDSGELVGYCDLDAQTGQKEISYVGLLGARLSAHGKGVGKSLLREAIRRACEEGYGEVTLYTWAGNTKAVPLYKKTGFNWVPDTDVYMRNFIPSALAMPIVRDFLGDEDWYTLHDRDLTVAPDDVTWKGMKVYPYRFARGTDYVQLAFQADSAGLTSIETPEFALSCTVPVEEAAAGQTYPIVWEIESRCGRDLEVTLLAEGEPGLEVSVQERFVVSGSKQICRSVRVDPNARPKRGRQRAHKVRSTVLIDGRPITLETGVKVVLPIEITCDPHPLIAGRQEQITVQLRSRLASPISGTLSLESDPTLACADPIQPISIPAGSWSERRFKVTASASGAHMTRFHYHCLQEGADERNSSVVGTRTVVLKAFAGSETVASIDAVEMELASLESLDLRLQVSLRGGSGRLCRPVGSQPALRTDSQLGPPFRHSLMLPSLDTARIEPCLNGSRLVVSAPSEQIAGLSLERSYTIVSGGVLRMDHRVVNTTGAAQPTQVRFSTHTDHNGFGVAPTPQGLLREPLRSSGEYPTGETDVLAAGQSMTEAWTAIEDGSQVCGLLWQGDPKLDVEWSRFPHLTFDIGEIPAYSSVAAPPVWLVEADGDWHVVRSWWRRLVQAAGIHESEQPVPSRVLTLNADPSPILMVRASEEAALVMRNRRGIPLDGELRLTGARFLAEPSRFDLKQVDRDRPFRADAVITAPDQPEAGFLEAEIDSGVVTERRKVPVVRLSAGDSTMAVQSEQGRVVIENGYFTLRFATGFFGALTRLEVGGVNQLLTSWPEAKPFIWMNPWFGGVHAFNHWMGDAELPREKFTGEPIERIGERGLHWQGVRMACDLKHKDRRWLSVELEYLATAGSNVVALLLRHTNRSDARMQLTGGVGAWVQPGGCRENAMLHWERDGEHRTRKRGGFSADGTSGKWVGVENPETKDALLLIATGQSHVTAFEDFGAEGPHIQAHGRIDLSPNETEESLFWLVHTKEIAQAEAYGAALSEARRLP